MRLFARRTASSGRVTPLLGVFLCGLCFMLGALWNNGSSKSSAIEAGLRILGAGAAPQSNDEGVRVSDAEAMEALRAHVELLNNGLPKPPCKVRLFGKRWWRHSLCTDGIENPCFGLTYGIENNYSFETELVEKANCTVFGNDPTVNYMAEIQPNFYFLRFAAPGRNLPANWTIASPVNLFRTLVPKGERLSFLKMDCEGCEYALYDDIVESGMPDFFHSVNQLSLEIHISKRPGWMYTREDMLNFGRLVVLLSRAGLNLVHKVITPCVPDDEALGCLPEFQELGVSCKIGTHCHNYLFARSYN